MKKLRSFEIGFSFFVAVVVVVLTSHVDRVKLASTSLMNQPNGNPTMGILHNDWIIYTYKNKPSHT